MTQPWRIAVSAARRHPCRCGVVSRLAPICTALCRCGAASQGHNNPVRWTESGGLIGPTASEEAFLIWCYIVPRIVWSALQTTASDTASLDKVLKRCVEGFHKVPPFQEPTHQPRGPGTSGMQISPPASGDIYREELLKFNLVHPHG
jgi:hypothetical protein